VEHDAPSSLADVFWAVARRMRHLSREALAPWEVSPSQLRALGTLLRHGPVRPSELARHLGIAARSATEVVDALEDRGLVRRDTDPADRRATIVAVTDHGREIGLAIRRARAAEADRLFTGLSERDRAELERLLRLVLAEEAGGETDAPAQSTDEAPGTGAR
jgi:DNA-binding MarR family transcriptional regulator